MNNPVYSFRYRQKEFKEFFYQEKIWYFVM